ncbi:hypothetical protein [Dokdonella sp.]|uniref:hypothetical protein n=1 Tax=Dokdonella sp. TaxID=2291710 RepID=UPI002DD64AFF|nr:hypothetical protein [Dokdonella sp.]
MIRKLLIASLVTAVPGCGGGGGSGGSNTETPKTPKEQVSALETSGFIPQLDRGTSLTGSDANSNGVRDDIETFIAKTYSTEPRRAAALQTAKALQHALVVNLTDATAVKAVDRQISYGINCIYKRFADNSPHPARVTQELESVTTNTKERLLAYLQFNKALDGTSSALPQGDTCE